MDLDLLQRRVFFPRDEPSCERKERKTFFEAFLLFIRHFLFVVLSGSSWRPGSAGNTPVTILALTFGSNVPRFYLHVKPLGTSIAVGFNINDAMVSSPPSPYTTDCIPSPSRASQQGSNSTPGNPKSAWIPEIRCRIGYVYKKLLSFKAYF